MERKFISVDQNRAAVRNIELSWADERLCLDLVLLDTGANMGIIGPMKEVVERIPRDSCWRDSIKSWGGELEAVVFDVTISLEHPGWVIKTQLYAVEADKWCVGLPVLRQFNLHLRHDVPGAPFVEAPAILSR